MTLDKVDIEFYETGSTCPVRDFLDALPPKAYRKAFWTISTVQSFTRASSHYFKKLVGTNGLYEIRVTYSRNDMRLIGFFAPGEKFIIVHAFFKKTQETPGRDIELSMFRKSEYLKSTGRKR